MRVLLELGTRSVDIDDNENRFPSLNGKEEFLDMLDIALDALDISGQDLVDHWTIKYAEEERDDKQTQ